MGQTRSEAGEGRGTPQKAAREQELAELVATEVAAYMKMWEAFRFWDGSPGSAKRAYETTRDTWHSAKKATTRAREALKG